MTIVHKVIAAAFMWSALSLTALAQSFPSKPVHIVVPYEPGGAVDLTARALSPAMAEEFKQPVIIENRGGAGGQIGAQIVVNAPPDGYTFMFTVGATLILEMFTKKNTPYNAIRDFTPITAIADSVLALAAPRSFPPDTIKELIEYARRNPGKVNYGTTAVGGITHLAMEQLIMLAGVEMTHVPYKGGGPLSTNLIGAQIPLAIMPLVALMPHIRAGKVKVLGLFLSSRYQGMPDVPTVAESVPGYQNVDGSGVWVFGPAGMPDPVVQRIRSVIVAALNVPENRKIIESRGQIVVGSTPQEFAAQIARMADLSGKLVRAIGFKPE